MVHGSGPQGSVPVSVDSPLTRLRPVTLLLRVPAQCWRRQRTALPGTSGTRGDGEGSRGSPRVLPPFSPRTSSGSSEKSRGPLSPLTRVQDRAGDWCPTGPGREGRDVEPTEDLLLLRSRTPESPQGSGLGSLTKTLPETCTPKFPGTEQETVKTIVTAQGPFCARPGTGEFTESPVSPRTICVRPLPLLFTTSRLRSGSGFSGPPSVPPLPTYLPRPPHLFTHPTSRPPLPPYLSGGE